MFYMYGCSILCYQSMDNGNAFYLVGTLLFLAGSGFLVLSAHQTEDPQVATMSDTVGPTTRN